MRFLFTFAGGSGHFEPLVPVARAAQAAGHKVAFAGEPAMQPAVEAAGFNSFAAGPNTSGTTRRPLLALDQAREDRALSQGYAGRTARGRAADLLPVCDRWQPEALVCDEIDFGSMVAAERMGLPHASVLVIAAGSFVRPALVAAPLAALRAIYSLPADPALAMLSRHLVLSPFPPSYRDPAFPLPATAHSYRPFDLLAAPAPAPWPTALPGAPTVYFTLGTVFNMESGDLFARVLAGLSALPLNLVVTVGQHIDPAEFGPQPPNIHIERYLPQALVMPHCDLVICHGGSGSVISALAHGLPLVIIPLGADQPLNAGRCVALGVGQMLDPLTATPEAVTAAVSAVLAEPRYRRAAEALRAEIAALPGAEHTTRLLVQLATEKRPILSA